ncbi:MAG: YvcK family protein [Firmicutes bacterium]|nr:YvcK family protein [Bacillota bacterium]
MRIARWFLPGLNIKRWVFLLSLGVIMAGEGIAIASDLRFLARIEQVLLEFGRSIAGGQASPVGLGVAVFVVGVGLCAYAVNRLVHSIVGALAPGATDSLTDIVFQKRYLERGPRIVAIGGGSGLSVLLRGLKEYTNNITAIVTVADDGGSSGRLRRDIGMLPPGDVRNCLVALADTEPLMEALFQHRFRKGELRGHSFGNLFLAAMTEMTGDFEEAVRQSSKVLAIRGRVLPSTLENVTLCAEVAGGNVVRGESSIPQPGRQIRRVFLDPPDPQPLPEAIRAIEEADAIVIGPGSLYTSIMPNLSVRGIAEAVRRSKALRIYVCNVMTQPGETDGYDAAAHVLAVAGALGEDAIDAVVCNSEEAPEPARRRYLEQGAVPVGGDVELGGATVVSKPLVTRGDYVRHDPHELAKCIMRLMGRVRKGRNVVLS